MSKLQKWIIVALIIVIAAAALFIVDRQFDTGVGKSVVATVSYKSEETKFVQLLNEYRQANGLGVLLISDAISEAALRHSADMAKYNFMSHSSVQSDYFPVNASPWDRMATSGYNYNTWKAENVAAGQSTAEIVFNDWKNSPGHNQNMLNPNIQVIGIGLAYNQSSDYKYYWTTDFGGFVDSTSHEVNPTTTTTDFTVTTWGLTTTTTLPPPVSTTSTSIPTTPTTIRQYFKDISPDFYAFKEIQYCYEKGYFGGYDDGTFKPYTNILVGHIHNILKDGDKKNYYSVSTRRYISDLLGIALYGKDNFELGLDDYVLRSQVAILLYSRDTGERTPSASNSLIGYLDKSQSETNYLTKVATGAKLTVTPAELVGYYNKWAPLFGIRSDFALAQAIKETAHFEYGGVVKWDANNFCGLSAGPGEPVVTFATAELGVIAQLAHLAAYAYPTDVNAYCSSFYDPKHRHSIYNTLNPNGGSTVWSQLNGVWAIPGTTYAQDIARIASRF